VRDLQPLNPKNSAVLIVEDDPDDAIIVGRALEVFGIRRMHLAETAEEALHVLERDSCDVVLLDYNLPGMNGLRLLERIRKTWPKLPVVLITGLRDESIAVSAMKAGATDYIAKDDLLTSSVIRSLQGALRGSITSNEEERRVALSSGTDKLRVAIEEGAWQLDVLRRTTGQHEDAMGRNISQYGEEDIGGLLDAFTRYLTVSFESFPRAARVEEEALARMLMDRGSSPAELVAVYIASLRALSLEGVDPPFSPALALVQLLAYVVDQYQLTLSLSALNGASSAAGPRSLPGDAPALAA
jgi:DNA-binding response OmpR family regulator